VSVHFGDTTETITVSEVKLRKAKATSSQRR
jgi:hypothetical protein